MPYCSRCGNHLDEKAVICVRCGEPCKKKTPGTVGTSGGTGLLIASILIPLIGVIIGFVQLDNNKPELGKKCFIGAAIGAVITVVIAVVFPMVFILLLGLSV